MDNEYSFLGKDEVPLFAPSKDDKTVALLAHVLTFVAGIIAPLVIYLVKKDESTFVMAHAKESLNFQITLLIAFIVLFISVIGIFLIWLLALLAVVLVIVATLRASEGKLYRYPATIRFIK